jgi:import inner membrane translocase subunit TIM16
VQLVIIGGRIFGKALLEAGRQAVKSGQFCRAVRLCAFIGDRSRFADAKHRPAIASSDAVGVNNATSQSLTDRLTREHRMTLDEARMVLNVRPQDNMNIIAQVRLSMLLSSLLFSAVVRYL